MNEKIDFVITWVDENDKKWQLEKEKYFKLNNVKKSKLDNRDSRYREMGCLKYWFRGIEKYAPWINRIYFITYGHIPEWLNLENKKLKIVKHEDYIPKEYLPTFNSNVIEAKIHKIDGLEEKFVYFNDDMFLINSVKKTDFFKDNLPCDTMCLEPIIIKSDNGFYKKICNDIEIINKHFSLKESFKKNKRKYMSLKQKKYLFRTLSLLNYSTFLGFHNFHMPVSYLKSTFEEVWDVESEILEKTMSFKFRNNEESVNHWLFQYWQFAKGNFYQRQSDFGAYLKIYDKNLNEVIEKQKYKMICINDYDADFDFKEQKNKIIKSFEKILPEKSTFEI